MNVYFSNKFSELPSQPMKFTKLKKLDLSYNYIARVPDDFLACLSALETLELNGNGLICEVETETSEDPDFIQVKGKFGQMHV